MRKRLCAMLLAAVMLCGSALAEVSALDRALSGYLSQDDQLHFAMSLALDTLTPYGEDTIAMMNGVLRHLSVDASAEEEKTTLAFCSDGDRLMELTETVVDGGTQLTTDLLPNRTLQSSTSALAQLAGDPANADVEFDFFRAVEELEDCYQALTDAIIPYAEEKKANYNIKNVASSRWSRVARLTVEQSTELSPLIAAVLGCGMDEAYRSQLEGLTCSKNFVVALYQTEQGGRDLAVYMKGFVTPADGKPRALAFQWAFTEKEGIRIDTLKYELVKSKTKIDFSRQVHASMRRRADDQLVLDGEVETIVKTTESTVTTTHTYDLSGKEKKGVRTIAGTVSEEVQTKLGDKTTTVTTTLTPDLQLTSTEGVGVLSGTMGYAQKTGKITHVKLSLLFDEEPARLLAEAALSGKLYAVSEDSTMPPSSLNQNVEITISGEEEEKKETGKQKPEDYLVGQAPVAYPVYPVPREMTAIDLDHAAAEELDALVGELSQRIAGRLLVALTKLPDEDQQLIRYNMSEEDYAMFLSLVDDL